MFKGLLGHEKVDQTIYFLGRRQENRKKYMKYCREKLNISFSTKNYIQKVTNLSLICICLFEILRKAISLKLVQCGSDHSKLKNNGYE